MQIHQNYPLSFNTLKLVAFPSFHTIWSILILFLIYNYRYLFYILLIINCSIILSTVLLGWHYLSDVLASFVVCGLSYLFWPIQV